MKASSESGQARRLRPLRGFYAILDPDHCRARDPLRVARAILAGGCAVMQLRYKAPGDGAQLALARQLRDLCRFHDVTFVINDRVDIALASKADGVHLGQGDLPVEEVRALAPRLQCGVSTHTPRQAEEAVRGGAELIGYGPVFATGTKENPDPVVGLVQLEQVVRRVSVPVIAIGGITLERVPEVAATGVPLVCAIGAVLGADDPGQAARTIHQALQA